MRHASPAQMQLGLRIHAMAFVPTAIILIIINGLVGRPYWVGWVLPGWGMGLFNHWRYVRHHTRHPVAHH